jgi:hypothetical protein
LSVPIQLHLHEELSGALTVTQTHPGLKPHGCIARGCCNRAQPTRGALQGSAKRMWSLVSEDQEEKV